MVKSGIAILTNVYLQRKNVSLTVLAKMVSYTLTAMTTGNLENRLPPNHGDDTITPIFEEFDQCEYPENNCFLDGSKSLFACLFANLSRLIKIKFIPRQNT